MTFGKRKKNRTQSIKFNSSIFSKVVVMQNGPGFKLFAVEMRDWLMVAIAEY